MTGRLAVVDHPPVYIYTRTALDCRSVTSPSFFFLLSFSRPWRLTSNKLSSGTVSPTNSAAGYQPRLFLSKLLCRISTALNLIPLLVQRLWSVFITAGQERKRDLLCPTNRLFNFLRRERGVRYLGTRASLSSVDDFFSSFCYKYRRGDAPAPGWAAHCAHLPLGFQLRYKRPGGAQRLVSSAPRFRRHPTILPDNALKRTHSR